MLTPELATLVSNAQAAKKQIEAAVAAIQEGKLKDASWSMNVAQNWLISAISRLKGSLRKVGIASGMATRVATRLYISTTKDDEQVADYGLRELEKKVDMLRRSMDQKHWWAALTDVSSVRREIDFLEPYLKRLKTALHGS